MQARKAANRLEGTYFNPGKEQKSLIRQELCLLEVIGYQGLLKTLLPITARQ